MKFVAILQLADLIIPILFIFNVPLSNNSETMCRFISFTMNLFIEFQSFWVAVIARFSYRALYLGIDKEEISVLKPFIIGFSISVLTSVFPLIFNCYKPIDKECGIDCDSRIEIIFAFTSISLIVGSLIFSLFLTFLLLKKLKIDLKNKVKEMKWSFIRLTVYPFITIVCSGPGIACFIITLLHGSLSINLIVLSSWSFNLIGFFNSIALGFTREFREALRFNKTQKMKPLIN